MKLFKSSLFKVKPCILQGLNMNRGEEKSDTSLVTQLLRISRSHTLEEMKQDLRALDYNIYSEQRYEIEDAPIVLIRHGFSDYNYCMRKVKSQDIATKFLVQSDINLMDASLHQAGHVQLQQKANHLRIYNFDIIFVSPLRRALQSALELFKNHPNKSQMKFIVIPHLCEIIGDSNDIQLSTKELIEEFTLLFYKEQLQLDFSLLTQIIESSEMKDFWQLEVAQNPAKKQAFIECYKSKFKDNQNVTKAEKQQFLISIFKKNLKEGILENIQDALLRAPVAKQVIIDSLKGLIRFQVDIGSQKIAIISHQLFIQSLSGGKDSQKSFFLMNAEVAPFYWKDLEN